MHVYELNVVAEIIVSIEKVEDFPDMFNDPQIVLISMSKPRYELIPISQSMIEFVDEEEVEFIVFLAFDELLDLGKISNDNCWVSRG